MSILKKIHPKNTLQSSEAPVALEEDVSFEMLADAQLSELSSKYEAELNVPARFEDTRSSDVEEMMVLTLSFAKDSALTKRRSP